MKNSTTPNGTNKRRRILFIVLFALYFLMFWISFLVVSPWLSAKTTDSLYSLLHFSLLLVTIGVVIEEWELFWKAAEFFRILLSGEVSLAISKARLHRKEIVASGGFFILVFGLTAEVALDPLIEGNEKAEQVGKSAEIAVALSKAADANTRAAQANTRSAALLTENVELERALAPRDINLFPLVNALRDIPRIPIFVTATNHEEPKTTAGGLLGLPSANFGKGDSWSVSALPLVPWAWGGIRLSFVRPVFGVKSAARDAAIALCESLNSIGIDASTEQVNLDNGRTPSPGWTLLLPQNALLIVVGPKPNLFWENRINKEKGLPEDLPFNICTDEDAAAFSIKKMNGNPMVRFLAPK